MQTLYGVEPAYPKNTEDFSDKRVLASIQNQAKKQFQEQLDQTAELFAYFAYIVCQVALYAEKDAKLRSEKYLKTEEDLNVSVKIAGNLIVWDILENPNFIALRKSHAWEEKLDTDYIRLLYKIFIETPEYKEYIKSEERSLQSDKAIFKFLWTEVLLEHEDFNNYLSEDWNNWDDDYELNLILLDSLLKRSKVFNFQQIVSVDKLDFSFELLETVISKQEYLTKVLLPKLKNWDPDRLAMIDMILLKMGISEFLYFDTIPTKVTINEYIEIGKQYSTAQSGQFINGVLDNILKDLESNQSIYKIKH